MPSPSSLRAIEEVYSLRLLVTLLDKKKMHRSLLYQTLGAIRPVMARIDSLVEAGLIKETAEEAPPFKKVLELTHKGVMVAKLLIQIEKTLELEP